MEHIDVFLLNTLVKEQFNLSTEAIVLQLNAAKTLPMLVTWRELENFMKYPPSEKHVIHGLKRLGYQTKFIAEYLKIPASNVSYHLKHAPKRPYVNPIWQAHASIQKQQLREAEYIRSQYSK
jgi:hypothetical protein